MKSWSSAILVKFAVLLRCSLAMGIKQLGQAARVVQRAVHGVEQRQIAELGTTVNVALRKMSMLITIVFD